MIKNIASVLEISEDQVNIKATTEEGLGFTGEGWHGSQAVCLIESMMNYQVDVTPADGSGNCGSCEGCPRR